jgi:hypothetical protein
MLKKKKKIKDLWCYFAFLLLMRLVQGRGKKKFYPNIYPFITTYFKRFLFYPYLTLVYFIIFYFVVLSFFFYHNIYPFTPICLENCTPPETLNIIPVRYFFYRYVNFTETLWKSVLELLSFMMFFSQPFRDPCTPINDSVPVNKYCSDL